MDDSHTPTYEVGRIYQDGKGERYMRVDDPSYPWRFLDSLAEGGIAEPRDEDFPHKPLTLWGPKWRVPRS